MELTVPARLASGRGALKRRAYSGAIPGIVDPRDLFTTQFDGCLITMHSRVGWSANVVEMGMENRSKGCLRGSHVLCM